MNKITRRKFLLFIIFNIGIVAFLMHYIKFFFNKSVIQPGIVEVNLSDIKPGQTIIIMWDKKPVFITHRTPAQIIAAQNVDLNVLIDPQEDVNRVKKPEWLVTIAICTHSGCVPNINKTTAGGLICPCHGSEYDTSHRIRQGPAAKNLAIPPYRFITNDILQIGKQV